MFSCLSIRRFSKHRLSDVRLSLVKPPLHGSMLLKALLTKYSHYKLPFRIAFQRLVGLLNRCSYLGCLKIACLLLYKWRNVCPRTMTMENYVDRLCNSALAEPTQTVPRYRQWIHSSVSWVAKLPIMILYAIYFWQGKQSVCNYKSIVWLLFRTCWWCNRYAVERLTARDDVIKWKHFPRYWPFVRGIHRSPVLYGM